MLDESYVILTLYPGKDTYIFLYIEEITINIIL